VSVRLGGVCVTSRYCVEADERIELKTGGSTLGRAVRPVFGTPSTEPRKLAVNWFLLKIPPLLARVATLPCETLTSENKRFTTNYKVV